MKDYLVRVGNALSQLLNTVFLNGHPNESISGRSYREGWHTAQKVIDTIFWFDPEHCMNSHLNERVWCRALFHRPPYEG